MVRRFQSFILQKQYLNMKRVRWPSIQKDRDNTDGGYGGLMVANPDFLLRFLSLHHLHRLKFFLYRLFVGFLFLSAAYLFWVFMLFFNKRVGFL